CDKAEQPVLDLVPLAGSGWKMTNHQSNSQLVGQLLQTDLPKSTSRTVAPAPVGGDQQILRSVKPAAAHLRPPTADAVRGELRRVMVGSDTHPTLIVENVVDAVRNHFAQGLVLEVMDADFWRLALGMPFSPVILEIPDQFLLFCVDRNRRLPLSQAPTHQTVDVTELGVTVGVRIALTGFAIGLKAVAGFMQERRNCHPANRMTHLCQFIRQTS